MKIKLNIEPSSPFYTTNLTIFHLYLKTSNNSSFIGRLSYLSAHNWRSVFLRKKNGKKINKLRGIICRLRDKTIRLDGSERKSQLNSIILLKKKILPVNSKIVGSSILELKYKKYLQLFKNYF